MVWDDGRMNKYTPLFSQVVDSSLWCEPDDVVKVFMTMLAKQDHDHIVRGTAFNVAMWSHKSEGEVLKALAILEAADTKRLEPQPFDGRRIEKVEGGWLVLNGEKYQREMQRVNRREYQRQWAADRRKGKAGRAPSGRERRFEEAVKNGDEAAADRIAAEGLPGEPSAEPGPQ